MSYPNCPRDTPNECRFTQSPGETTCVWWQPVYDREGRQTNHDPNRRAWTVNCLTCGTLWTAIQKNGAAPVEYTRESRS